VVVEFYMFETKIKLIITILSNLMRSILSLSLTNSLSTALFIIVSTTSSIPSILRYNTLAKRFLAPIKPIPFTEILIFLQDLSSDYHDFRSSSFLSVNLTSVA
jgi:hypothetical protein